uniref:Uncharacterized protein n=1 Tax=Panagrolaimus sp. PS1159 TaxID=55785 RepID=A0AC35GSF4_9BILA
MAAADRLDESVIDVDVPAPIGKLFVGGIVLTTNDTKITNVGEFFKATKTPGKYHIRIKRDEYCTCKVSILPAPKAGTESFEYDMNWRTGGMLIGILVYQVSDFFVGYC